MSDNLKKLTGKNQKEYEAAASALVNIPDVELFSELVEKDDFLFDFVKQNVAKRLENACNEANYLNLLKLLKYYSPSYEDFIIAVLVRFADEELTDKMLEIFENGTDEEKTYCAKFFTYIQDFLALDLLRKNSYSENSALSANCAAALGILKDRDSYKTAVEKLHSDDEFTRLDGVNFLVSYGDKNAVSDIIDTMKKSSLAENIAGELPYLCDLFELYKLNSENSLYVLNLILNGLGEILGLSVVFDLRLYEFLEMLIKTEKNSQIAAVLINAQDKFEILTENDEYLFDESKDTKQEILEIKQLLKSADTALLYGLIDEELNPESLFVYTALEFTENEVLVRNLLSCKNPTVVLKSLEVLKLMEALNQNDKETALAAVCDENIKNVIMAI